jgi:hypothetical protein
MPPLRTAAGLLAALCLLGPPPARAGVTYGDLTVNVEDLPQAGTHGYTELWVSLTNRSEQARQVRLTLPRDTLAGWGDHVRSLGRTVEVGAKSTARVSLLLPTHPAVIGTGMSVAIDGKAQDEGVPVNFGYSGRYAGYYSGYGGGYMMPPLVLVSRGVPADFPEFANQRFARISGPRFGGMPGGAEDPEPAEEPNKKAEKEDPKEDDPAPGGPAGPGGPGMAGPGGFGGPSASYAPRVQFARPTTPLAAWSPNWLGYTSFDAVLVTADDLKAMPAATQTALWQYTECGGMLVVLGRADLPESWKGRPAAPPGLEVRNAGFGMAATLPDVGFKKWPAERWERLLAALTTTTPVQRSRSSSDITRNFPVIDDAGVPVKGLFILMVVFAVVIGPVNLILLSRWKRKLLLLATVPALSLVTCLAVFGYMLLSEGWEGHARIEGVTLLDEGTRRAVSFGWEGFYSPLTPSDGLHFSRETEVAGVFGETDPMRYRHSEGGSACTMDWTDDQHLISGWVTARVPAHFAVRKAETRRERVAFTRNPDGTFTALNELGADIDKLFYADELGKVHAAERVAAGARVPLRATGEGLPAEGREWAPHRLFTTEWASVNVLVRRTPTAYLVPRGYLATLEAAPFLDEGLLGARTRKARSVVIGIPREGPHAD